MSLYLEPLYNDCVRGFQTTTDDSRFKADFIRAVNNVFDDLSNAAKMSTAISHVVKESDTSSSFDTEHSVIIFEGLIYHLVNMGYRHVRGDDAYAVSKTNWENRKADWMVIKSLEDQEDQDDDGICEDDVVGLGYVGDE